MELKYLVLLPALFFSTTSCDSDSERKIQVSRTGSSVTTIAADDTEVRLDKAVITFYSLELTPCESSFKFPTLISSAYAHDEDASALGSGVPYVVDVIGSNSDAVTLANFEHVDESICSITFDVSPADSDAELLSANSEMLDHTLHLVGAYKLSGSDTFVDFDVITANGVSIPLEVDQDFSTFVLGLNADVLFGDVDMTRIDSDSEITKLISNLQVAWDKTLS